MLRFANGTLLEDAELLSTLENDYARQQRSTLSIVLCCVYGALCAFGLAGNGWAIWVIVRRKATTVNSANDGLVLYILSLCVVDSLLLAVTPFLIVQLILKRWVHDEAACKFYWAVESGGKVLSVFLLTALSFDRYLAVCLCTNVDGTHPWRTVRATLTVVGGSAAICAALLTPIYAYAGVQQMEHVLTIDNATVHFLVPHCTLSISQQLQQCFAIYMFIAGFATPAILIAWFYSKIIERLKTQVRCMDGVRTSSRIPIGRVIRITSVVIVFYFFCQTPYWCNNLYLAIVPLSASEPPANFRKFVANVAHVLPFINSSCNWACYALLNTQLRHRRETLTPRCYNIVRRTTHSNCQLEPRNGRHSQKLSPELLSNTSVSVPQRLTGSQSKLNDSSGEIFL